jgi:hypothetical protein
MSYNYNKEVDEKQTKKLTKTYKTDDEQQPN